eukprot:jgi/Psemu1/282740/fgenesh1_pg.13_\
MEQLSSQRLSLTAYKRTSTWNKVMKQIFSFILLLLTVTLVLGNDVDKIEDDEVPNSISRNSRKNRRARAYLPSFSKSKSDEEVGTVNSANRRYDGYYEWEWKGKSDKKSGKSGKKEKKDGKKDKTEKHYGYYGYYGYGGKGKPTQSQTKLPTAKPVLSPTYNPTPAPSLKTSHESHSNSEDMHSTSGTSIDCPPVRPPTIIPPSPTYTSTKAAIPSPVTAINEKDMKSVGLEIYAIDYNLSETDRTPIKIDFLALQELTQSFLREYMLKAYEVSAQAKLVDFTTSFVTAHFTPGEPVHIQYNSTAFFDDKSINIPTQKTLFTVVEQSLVDPQLYIGDLQSKLNEVNPFSSTANASFTGPKTTPMTRSSTKSKLGIASAGVAAALTFTVVAGIVLLRKKNSTDGSGYSDSLTKPIKGDTTVAGETYISRGSSLSASSSTGSVNRNEKRSSTSLGGERINTNTTERAADAIRIMYASNELDFPERKPRTVADIERLYSLRSSDII